MPQKLKQASQRSELLWTSVPQHIREVVEKLAVSQGLTISEYIRKLVIEDLDRRSIFTSLLKEEIAKNG